MKIAITTPTGHIGSKVTERLLDAAAKVVLLVRDTKKVEPYVRRGAEVREGSLEDAGYVTEATRDVDALFWLTPPNFKTTDLREYQRQLGRTAAEAIRTNKIPRIVNLSSIGAQLPSGTGPITGLRDVERMLDAVAAGITHLRCGYFFENYLYQLEHIRSTGSIYLPISGSVRAPMVATRDIAHVAADRLLGITWTGQSVRGVHGPADLSFDGAAEEISLGIGARINHVKVAESDVRPAMLGMGLSENVVEQMLEMYRAIDSGLLRPTEPRTAETTTPTTLEEFTRETIAPLVAAPVGAQTE